MKHVITEDVRELTESIVESYKTDARTQRIGSSALPSRGMIVEIVNQTRAGGAAGGGAQPQAAPQPPPQPAPRPEPKPGETLPGHALPPQVFVSLDCVRVYEKPDAGSAALAVVARGTRLRVQAQDGDWYCAALPDGRVVWILSVFTSPTTPP